MIILIHGEDQFRSSLKTRELVKEYMSLGWDLFKFDFLDKENIVNLNELKSKLETQGLFSNNRVVLIKNWLTKMTKRKKKDEENEIEEEEEKGEIKEISELLKNSDDKELMIILQEDKEIGNQRGIKNLKIKIEEFPLLKGRILNNWISKEAEIIGIELDKEVIEVLAVAFEGDTGTISNELKRLSLLNKRIAMKEFLELTRLPNNPIDFELSNAIGDKNKKLALMALYKEIEAETVPMIIFGSIIYQMRNLLMLKMAEGNPRINIRNAGLHPFVVSKTRSLARKFTLEELQKAYKKLFQYDVSIKKGKIDAILALELFINEFTR